MTTIKIGDIVRAKYNSGKYIGEVMEDRDKRFLIKVLAVEKHPMQGDLHNPGQVDGVFFHERKALAHFEKMNVVKSAVHPFEGEVPDYNQSLHEAIDNQKQKLALKDSEFNQKALEWIEGLEEKYYTKSYYK
ncbi:kinase-associated lipoprotein B [Virgibacillus sp. JSM 102003]|uniref:kinase-associated lipoprotein B n=1 Tax=Virgibacillus sp. JSM 102003 TaxID=1562108 RepID=UPI0035C06892